MIWEAEGHLPWEIPYIITNENKWSRNALGKEKNEFHDICMSYNAKNDMSYNTEIDISSPLALVV